MEVVVGGVQDVEDCAIASVYGELAILGKKFSFVKVALMRIKRMVTIARACYHQQSC